LLEGDEDILEIKPFEESLEDIRRDIQKIVK
jgi:hypothetical protein